MTKLKLNKLNGADACFHEELSALLDRSSADNDVSVAVMSIISRIRSQGDQALLDLTREFDRFELGDAAELEVSTDELDAALARLDSQLRDALRAATERIRQYHLRQAIEPWDYLEPDGTRLGQKVTPLDRVGIYVPGGKAAYPSSVLMNAIPAKTAGVRELIMAVPAPGGEVNDSVLAAAALAEVDQVFRIGGAQAIAAMAYGTETVPRVDKIVGPGNAYVACAKKLVFGQVGIDMVAGPSEVVVLCDASVDPEWVAMDLCAQAEHDEMAQAIVISVEQAVLDRIDAALHKLVPTLERAAIVRAALQSHGALVQVSDHAQAAQVINRIAPEHLELMLKDAEQILPLIRHAGAIFLGAHSAETLGDYCAGPNHVLPTAGTARFSSPLGVYDFQKRTSIIQCSPAGARRLAGTASILARAETLTAHARSAEYRMKENSE